MREPRGVTNPLRRWLGVCHARPGRGIILYNPYSSRMLGSVKDKMIDQLVLGTACFLSIRSKKLCPGDRPFTTPEKVPNSHVPLLYSRQPHSRKPRNWVCGQQKLFSV